MQSSDHVEAPGRAHDEDAIGVEPATTSSAPRANGKWNVAYVWLWLGAVGVGIVHFWLADGARGPGIFADEVGYLANARYLAGGGLVDMSNTAFYAGGWSLALAPLSRLSADDPGHFYSSVIALQSVLAVLSVVLIARLCKWLLDARWSVAILAACTGGLYTAYVTNSGFAWAESALTFTLLAVLTASVWLLQSVEDPSARPRTLVIRSIVTGIACGYFVTVHTRTLAATLGLLAVVTAFLVWKRKPAAVAATIISFAVTMYAGRVLNHQLRHALWKGKGGVDVSKRVSSLLSLNGVKNTIITGAGHAWYQLVATGGLVGIGVIALVLLACDRRGPNVERRVAATMVFVTFALLLAVSVAFVADGRRADAVVYGRYVDIATPLLIAVAITWLSTRPTARALVITATTFVVALFGSWLVLEGASGRFDRPYNRVTTFGIGGWLDYHGNAYPQLVRATLWTAVIGLGIIAIAYATRSSRALSWAGPAAICAVVVCLFGWQLTFVHPNVLAGLKILSNNQQAAARAVRSTGASKAAIEPSVDVVDRIGLAFWLPQFKFVKSNAQNDACSSVVTISLKPVATTPVVPLAPAGGMYLFRGQKAC